MVIKRQPECDARCPVCGTYLNSANLERHLRRIHGRFRKESTPIADRTTPIADRTTPIADRKTQSPVFDWGRRGYSDALSSGEIDADNRDYSGADEAAVKSWQERETRRRQDAGNLHLDLRPLDDPEMIPESKPAGYIDLGNMTAGRDVHLPQNLRLPCIYCGLMVSSREFQKHLDSECPVAKAERRANSVLPPIRESAVDKHKIDLTRRRTTCPVCRASVKPANLEKHLRKAHAQIYCEPATQKQVNNAKQLGKGTNITSATGGLTTCPECGVSVNPKNLDKHRRKVHGQIGGPPSPQKARSKAAKESVMTYQHAHAIDDPNVDKLGLVKDEFYDEQYGDKYLGQVRPQSNGQFGSIPLYDDHSDEGWPD